MPHGWIVLDKPVGLGSTQAVAAVKRNLRQAGYGKVKVGHGGTLDPLASGVLPIALGEATKLCGRMLDSDKEYAFTLGFGAETDTLDGEGKVIARSGVRPTRAETEAALPNFMGLIEQVPPAFSALKVEGERAYDRARAGEVVELEARQVTVHALESLPELGRGGGPSAQRMVEGAAGHAAAGAVAPSTPSELGEDCLDEIALLARVSKGTYIRSLARDLARALGTVGHLTQLRRTRAGPFALDRAISLDMLNAIGQGAPLERILLPLEAGLVDIPALDLDPEQARAVREGRVLTGLALRDGVCWARSGSLPLALMELSGGTARVLRGFNLPDVAE